MPGGRRERAATPVVGSRGPKREPGKKGPDRSHANQAFDVVYLFSCGGRKGGGGGPSFRRGRAKTVDGA